MARWLFALAILATLPCVGRADVARYDVVVDAPGDLKSIIQDNLSLIRWRDADGRRGRVDADQLRRLFDQGRDEIERLVATEGYYRPTIDAELVPDGDRWIARYRVVPNASTTVASVDLSFVGPIASAPAGEPPDVVKLKEDWSLRTGDVFKQADWESNKRRVLQQLLIRTYPFASITRSEAQVDVRTDQAKLTVVIASGPAVRFGPLQITGLERYPEDIVRNLDPIELGELYSQQQVFEFQRRLNSSGYFSRVDVSIDAVADPGTDPRSPFVTDKKGDDADVDPSSTTPSATPATAHETNSAPATPLPREVTLPLRVSVDENKSRQVSVGLGYSTNSGPRFTAGYNILNFLGGAKQLRTTLSFDRLKQGVNADLLWPQTADGKRYSISSNAKREDVQNETTKSIGLSGRRAWGPETSERFNSIDYIFEHKDIAGDTSTTTQTLGTTYGVTLRRTDNLLAPTSGYMASAQVGAGVRLQSGEPFGRIYGKGVRYVPLGPDYSLLLRLELGAVAGPDTNTIPSALLFRAGGDGSVRGYGYQSLGVRQGDAIVGGRYVATGTVEAIRWLGPTYPQWGVALFVDAGNAGNRFADLAPKVGYGTGVRWRSPVGTLNFDIARGVSNGSIRLHFSLGVTF